MKKRLLALTIGAALLVVIGGGITYYYYSSQYTAQQGIIVDFVTERDTKPMLKLFHDDWYWLFPGPDYSPEYILKHKAPGDEPYQERYKGKLQIKVIIKDGKLAGFTTYYKKNFYEGIVQFVAVSPEFRRQGLGRILAEHAVNELFKMGNIKVTLTTRLNNPARRIYERMGFKKTGGDGEFVFYAITKKEFKPTFLAVS